MSTERSERRHLLIIINLILAAKINIYFCNVNAVSRIGNILSKYTLIYK
jgi:hypothetical protein